MSLLTVHSTKYLSLKIQNTFPVFVEILDCKTYIPPFSVDGNASKLALQYVHTHLILIAVII